MATKNQKVYAVFQGKNSRQFAIKVVKDIYDGLASNLGCQVLAPNASVPPGTTVLKTIEDALNNGVARIKITYEKGGRKQQGQCLCSADSADTVLDNINAAKYRTSNIVSAEFF